MLSILIPVYRFDFRPLLNAVYKSASKTGIPFEIICFDDGSGNDFDYLFDIDSSMLSETRIIRSPQNIGRSASRNKLASFARFDSLLFLDNDVLPVHEDFIDRYSILVKKQTLICGGRIYHKGEPLDPQFKLHWVYGMKRESKNHQSRRKNKYQGFHSNNFVISKSLFEKIKFEEKLKLYGHEDTLFGLELQDLHAEIIHINNPVIHIDLENWKTFIEKTISACENAVLIYSVKKVYVNLLTKISFKIYRAGVGELIIKLINIAEKQILKNLSGNKPNLLNLDLLKLKHTLKSIRNSRI